MIPARVEALLDELVSGFADLVLIERFQGTSEKLIAEQFACITTFDHWGLEPEIAETLRLRAYELLGARLNERWAHIIVPENYDTLH